MWYEEFVKRMPLEAGYVHISEICDMLREAYGAVELPEEQIPSLKWMHRFNALHTPENQEHLHLTEGQLHIRALQFPQEAGYSSREGNYENHLVYLAFEEQVGYIYSNSNELFLEVDIARGCNRQDIEGNTERYNVWKKSCVRYWRDTGREVGGVQQWKELYKD